MKLDADKVRWHRDSRGWTLETTAEQAEVALGTVLRAEHGEDIRPSSGRRIARAFGVDVSELVPEKPGRVEELATAGKAEAPGEAGLTYEEGIEQTERRLYGYPVIARGWTHFAERWSRRLGAGDFDEDVLEELIAGLEDFAPGMEANRAAERKELGTRYAAESVLRPAIENLTLLVREALAKADAANEEQERKLVRLEDRFKRAV